MIYDTIIGLGATSVVVGLLYLMLKVIGSTLGLSWNKALVVLVVGGLALFLGLLLARFIGLWIREIVEENWGRG